jgi:flagellar motor protein MotB
MARQNNNSSPAKFLSFLSGGAGRRREQRAANEDFGNQMDAWEDTKMTNPYAGVKNPYANMENVYEDQTVDLKAAEFAKEQNQQNAANIMNDLKGAAGGSGVAGLAQVLANQGQKQAQQASASIGMQEQANQARARGEAGRLQQLSREGEQKRDMLEREGARMTEQYDMDKQTKMLDFAMQRKTAADQAIANADAQKDQFISGMVSSGLGMLSDIRLKENINKTGNSESGIPIYTFNYKGKNETWSGTMAQDLINMGREDAVSTMNNGYYVVNYNVIDVDMELKQ